MSKFRQQSSIRVSSPRYTNPASGGLATGEAVILDSTPVVNTAIQLAEKDRANAQYFDYLKQEKAKKDEKDYIEFNDKLSKVLKQPAVAGLNRFDTELILKKLKSTREKAVNILGDVASSGNYMLKNKVLQQVQSEIDDIGSEIVSRKNAYEQRKSEYQANGKIMSLTGQSDYAARIESTPTLDEKGQYISLQYDPKYIEGADLSKIYKDVSERNNYSLDVPVSVVNKGEPASYNKYKLNKDRAYSMLVRSLQDELSTDNAVKVASSLGDEYNDFLRRNGQKEVPKDAFVSYRGVNKDNVNAILNDKRFVDEHLLINVHEKQDKGTFIPSKGKSGDENKDYLEPSSFRVYMETPNVVNERGYIVKSKGNQPIDIRNYQQRAKEQVKAFSPSQPFISLNINEKGQNMTTLGNLPNNEKVDLGKVKVLGIGEIPTANTKVKGSGEQLGEVLLTAEQAKTKKHYMKKYYHVLLDVMDAKGDIVGQKEGFVPATGVNTKPEKIGFRQGAKNIIDKVVSSIRLPK